MIIRQYNQLKRGTTFDKDSKRSFKKIFNVYLLLRDRDRARAWEGQPEEETQNLKQAPGSEMSAQSWTRGWNTQTVRS